MNEICKITHNKFYINLFEIHNNQTSKYATILGLNWRQQKEYITILMRFGCKGQNFSSLYEVVLSLNYYKKNLSLSELSQETFINYGESVMKFINFLLLFKMLSIKPHCFLNGNSAK